MSTVLLNVVQKATQLVALASTCSTYSKEQLFLGSGAMGTPCRPQAQVAPYTYYDVR